MKRKSHCGLSLVEMAIALGVLSIAILSVFSLLPVGVQNNKISADESFAASQLTALTADLRNTYPTASGRSQIFNLSLPYAVSASGNVILNSSLAKLSPTTTLSSASSGGFTIGLDDCLNPVAITATNPRPRFQASVVYTNIPTSGSLIPIEARIIINWPVLSNGTIADLTDSSKVEGYVQAYVTFEAP